MPEVEDPPQGRCARCWQVEPVQRYMSSTGRMIAHCDRCAAITVRSCAGCGESRLLRQFARHGVPLCFECGHQATGRCHGCGGQPLEQGWRFLQAGGRVCLPCAERWIREHGYGTCTSCWVLHTSTWRSLCDDCDDWCEDCGTNHTGDCAQCTCNDCLDDGYEEEPNLYGYSYKPAPVFQPHLIENGLFLGMELEVEAPTYNKRVEALALMDDDHTYCKSDGSLGEYGFELVTHPMTLEWAMANLPWSAYQKMRDIGIRSFDTDTCGIHIHLSRDAFYVPPKLRDPHCLAKPGEASPHLWRFLQFHHRNVGEICKIAGRNGGQWCEWDGVERENIVAYAKKKSTINDERYVAINLQNRSTIELRYFRGTLAEDGIKRNLQFAHAVFTYTRDLTVPDVRYGALEFQCFVDWLNDRSDDLYAEITQFVNDRFTQTRGQRRLVNA